MEAGMDLDSAQRHSPQDERQAARERQREIVRQVHGATASRTGLIALSAPLVRLAERLGVSPNTLAAKLDPETIRGTQFPVIEEVDAEGKIYYRQPTVIIDGVRSSRI